MTMVIHSRKHDSYNCSRQLIIVDKLNRIIIPDGINYRFTAMSKDVLIQTSI